MAQFCLQCPENARRFARARGLCRPCYGRCLSEVRRRQTTWAELERKGLTLPAQRKGEAWRRAWVGGRN
jgi:hypothetical protein